MFTCRQAFDLLPNLIDVLKDVLSASSSQETTRVGDISASVRVCFEKERESNHTR
jgi:hypothetical protein